METRSNSTCVYTVGAGTGILVAATISRLNGAFPHKIILNEISKSRNVLLHELFPTCGSIYAVDAEHLNDVLPQGEQPTLIVMNPPFSASVGRSKRNPDACLKHLRSALLRLQPNGRLVAIVAHWLSPEKYPEYFASLPAQLQLSLFIDGNHYRYHGTSMDVRILVFDKITKVEPIKSIDLKFSVTAKELASLAMEATPSRQTVKYCFDEAHMLGNAAGDDGERGQTKASAQALAGTQLINYLANARVTYLSATGAAKVSSLSYYQRMRLWQTKAFPFASRAAFISEMEASGTSALELVAQDLKRLGIYVARTLSFEGVKFETVVHKLTPAQREIWDTYAQAFVYIHHQIDGVLRSIGLENESGKCTNGRAKAAVSSQFESAKQRFFNALLCAAKAATLIDGIERDLAEGRSCVIQIVSTNEALMNRKLADIPTSQWGDMRAVDFTPRENIIDYLMNSFPINLYQTYVDDSGTTKSELMISYNNNYFIFNNL